MGTEFEFSKMKKMAMKMILEMDGGDDYRITVNVLKATKLYILKWLSLLCEFQLNKLFLFLKKKRNTNDTNKSHCEIKEDKDRKVSIYFKETCWWNSGKRPDCQIAVG